MAALRPLLNGIRHAALWPLAGKQTVDQGAEIMSFGFYHYVGNLATKWSLAPAEARQVCREREHIIVSVVRLFAGFRPFRDVFFFFFFFFVVVRLCYFLCVCVCVCFVFLFLVPIPLFT